MSTPIGTQTPERSRCVMTTKMQNNIRTVLQRNENSPSYRWSPIVDDPSGRWTKSFSDERAQYSWRRWGSTVVYTIAYTMQQWKRWWWAEGGRERVGCLKPTSVLYRVIISSTFSLLFYYYVKESWESITLLPGSFSFLSLLLSYSFQYKLYTLYTVYSIYKSVIYILSIL